MAVSVIVHALKKDKKVTTLKIQRLYSTNINIKPVRNQLNQFSTFAMWMGDALVDESVINKAMQ